MSGSQTEQTIKSPIGDDEIEPTPTPATSEPGTLAETSAGTPAATPAPLASQEPSAKQIQTAPITIDNGVPKPVESNSNMTELMKNMNEVVKSIGGMGRTIPTYDPNHKGATTIRSHIKVIEKMADRYQWSEKTKADELILSLRGQARKIAEALPAKVTDSYAEIKKQLIEAFSKDKPAAIQMRQWSMYSWQSDKQTIIEFATLLKAKLNKIARNTGQDPVSSELFLKNRLMEAIKDENPKFSKFIELNRDERVHNSYEKLYKFIQEKWDIYKTEEEEDEERVSTNILFNAEPIRQGPRQLKPRYPMNNVIDERFMHNPYRQQRMQNHQLQTGLQYGYSGLVPGNQYPRNYSGYGRKMFSNYPTNYITTYRPSTFAYDGRYQNPVIERQPRFNKNEGLIVSNRGQHDYYQQVPNQQANQFLTEKPQKYMDTKQNRQGERSYKEGNRKDKNQINRGTKVEEGQKVQFLERVKENQKN